MKIKKALFLFSILHLAVATLTAQEIQIQAPAVVAPGEQFTVRYIVNGKVDDFHGPKLTNAQRLSGPGTSTSTSISIINGHTQRSSSTTFTYLFMAEQEGTASFGPASCTTGGKQVSSKPFSIKVDKSAQRQQSNYANSGDDEWDDPFAAMQRRMQQVFGGGQQQQQHQSQQPATIDKNSLFAKASVSNATPYEGQQVIVTYKIYTQVSLQQYLIDKLPGNKGFWAEDLSANKTSVSQWEETVNGKRYMVAEIRRGALFAQESGKLTVEPLDLDVLAMVPRQRSGSIWDLFDDPFFNMGRATEVHLHTNPVSVNVKPLPAAPDGFYGAVGNFNITASTDVAKVRANEAVTYRVTISGSGNLPLVNAPDIAFPSVFEVYDPETHDKLTRNDNGVSGSRTFEWLLIPRNQGDYEIPDLNYTYFDPQSGKYVQQLLPSIAIHVDAADPRSANNVVSSKNQVNKLNSDINHIKSSHSTLQHIGTEANTPLWFWIVLAAIVCATIAAVAVGRHKSHQQQDVAGLRLKRSTREARRRLKKAAKYLDDGDDERFYEEVYKAIWGCLADKYNIELSQLSSDTVSQCLDEKQVSAAQKEEILQTLQEVDFARFGPGDNSTKKHSIYDKALNMIRNLTFILIAVLMLPATLAAAPATAMADNVQHTIALGDKAYTDGDYQNAISHYEQVLAQGMASHDLYYNLGNAYYRQHQIGLAILYYEKALRLKPNDGDTRENLDLARSKTADHIEQLPSERFNDKVDSIVGIFSLGGWRVTIVVLAALLGTCVAVYLLSGRRGIRKGAFFGGMAAIVLLVAAIFGDLRTRNRLASHNEVVVVQNEIAVMGAPENNSTLILVLHEGTTAHIDEELGDWYRIHIGDGNKGWVRKSEVEKV